jgi:hypothetical protein
MRIVANGVLTTNRLAGTIDELCQTAHELAIHNIQILLVQTLLLCGCVKRVEIRRFGL